MADTLESLEIEVKHSASGAAGSIGEVTAAIQKMGGALGNVLPALKEYASALKDIGKAASPAAQQKLTDQLPETPLETKDPGAMDSITGSLDTAEIENTASAMQRVKDIAASVASAIRSAFGAMRDDIAKAGAALSSVGSSAHKAKSGVDSAKKGVSGLAKESKKAKSPLDNIVASLKRIAFYRIIRSVIKAITSALSEGLQNAYAFSQGITTEGHRFAAALDSMSSAGLKMKNQIGSAFIGLLAAIAPIVNAIISLVTRVANALSQLFAVFTGGTYLKAADVPKKWGEAAGGAAKAAKEWKNQLLGFDEINRLEEPSDGGGGGGGAAIDPMSMFEDTPIDGIFKKMRDKLVELWSSLDFEPLKQSWDNLKESLQGLADVIISALGWAWENVLVPLAHWTIEEALPAVINLLAAAFDFLRAVLEALAPILKPLWEEVIQPLGKWTGEVIIKALEAITDWLERLTDLLSGNITFEEFTQQMDDASIAVAAVAVAVGVLGIAFGLITSPISIVIIAITAIGVAVVAVRKHFDEWKQTLQEFFSQASANFGNGRLEWTDFFYAIISAIQSVIGWFQSLWSWIQGIASGVSGLLSGIGGFFSGIGGRIGLFAEGGFPDEGQIFVAREAGPELVGSVGGRTAVANNDQIIEGIRMGVFEAVSAAMANNNSDDRPIKVYLDSKEIRAGQKRLERAWGV